MIRETFSADPHAVFSARDWCDYHRNVAVFVAEISCASDISENVPALDVFAEDTFCLSNFSVGKRELGVWPGMLMDLRDSEGMPVYNSG